MANWKKVVNYNSTKAPQRLVPAKDVNTEIIEGEFDHDDMSEALAAMRASKPSMVKARDSQKAMPVSFYHTCMSCDAPSTNNRLPLRLLRSLSPMLTLPLNKSMSSSLSTLSLS
jgi:hypothetical protein